jgi:hypothetical protein
MSAMTIRFLVQAGFGTVGVLVIVFGGWPWGVVIGTALIIFGLKGQGPLILPILREWLCLLTRQRSAGNHPVFKGL